MPPLPTPRPSFGHLASALGALLCGCATWNPAAVDLSDPAWDSHLTQAVWRPPGAGPVELAGDLLVATSSDGRGYLQFSKSPMTLAEAWTEDARWRAAFPAENRSFSGRGAPPARLAWAQVLLGLQGRPVSENWTWQGDLQSGWRLEHRASGEWIEGAGVP